MESHAIPTRCLGQKDNRITTQSSHRAFIFRKLRLTFTSYVTENTLRLHYKHQAIIKLNKTQRDAQLF
jgi:hypothetical protein